MTVYEVPECQGILKSGGITNPTPTCKEYLNKGYYYVSTFAVPAGETCTFWGNGFRYERSELAEDIEHEVALYQFGGEDPEEFERHKQ